MTAVPEWNAIKSEYITTTISYRDLAEKWGVSFRTLADHARKEHWADERNSYRNTVASQTVQKIAAITSTDNACKLARLQQATDKISAVIDDIFTDTDQFNRHIVQTRDGSTWDAEEREFKKIDTKAIKDLTGAIKDLAIAMRSIYDIPTVQEKSAMDIAAERLKLDKAKAEAESNTSQDITVELQGEIGEWSE